MLNIGILGAGRVVKNRYLEVFRDELTNCRVRVVCDKVPACADSIADSLGARAVYHMAELFEDDKVDCVLVATESGYHNSHARAALEAGKHVIVEKPPAMIPEQIMADKALADSKGLMYAVIFQNRLNPAMRILKKTFDSGRFGKLVLATIRLRWCRYQEYYEDGWHGTWAMDGGVINQQAIHHLDVLQWVCGPVEEVCSAQCNAINRLEAEDTTVAVIRFSSGALGAIEATTAARPDDFEASISLVGEKGTAVIGGIALNRIDTWRFVTPQEEDRLIPELHSQEVPTGYGLSHGPLMQQIVDQLNHGRTDPPISCIEVVPTVELVHALYCSQEKHRWVSLAERPRSKRLGIG